MRVSWFVFGLYLKILIVCLLFSNGLYFWIVNVFFVICVILLVGIFFMELWFVEILMIFLLLKNKRMIIKIIKYICI